MGGVISTLWILSLIYVLYLLLDSSLPFNSVYDGLCCPIVFFFIMSNEFGFGFFFFLRDSTCVSGGVGRGGRGLAEEERNLS